MSSSDYLEALAELTEYAETSFRMRDTGKITSFIRVVGPKLFKINIREDAHFDIESISEEIAGKLALFAETVPEAFDFAVEIVESAIMTGSLLPEPLQAFAILVLDGDLKRPSPSHREKRRDFFSSIDMYHMLATAHLIHGLRLTRNDVSEPTSACDAAAEALNLAGVETTFGQVKDFCVHPSRREDRERVEMALSILHGEKAFLLPKRHR